MENLEKKSYKKPIIVSATSADNAIVSFATIETVSKIAESCKLQEKK